MTAAFRTAGFCNSDESLEKGKNWNEMRKLAIYEYGWIIEIILIDVLPAQLRWYEITVRTVLAGVFVHAADQPLSAAVIQWPKLHQYAVYFGHDGTVEWIGVYNIRRYALQFRIDFMNHDFYSTYLFVYNNIHYNIRKVNRL